MSSVSSPTPKNEFFAGVLRYNLPSRIGEWAKSKVVMHFKRVKYWCLIGPPGLTKLINSPFNASTHIFHTLFEQLILSFTDWNPNTRWCTYENSLKKYLWNCLKMITFGMTNLKFEILYAIYLQVFLLKIISHLNTFGKHKQVPYKFGLAQNERKINAIMRVCHVE